MSRAYKKLGVLLLATACQGEIDGSAGPFVCPEGAARGQVDPRCFQTLADVDDASVNDETPLPPLLGASGCSQAAMLIRTRCALTGGCHGDLIAPDLSGDFEDGRLLDEQGPVCAPLPFIDTVDVEQSAILEKIQSSSPCNGRGTSMPPPNNTQGSEALDEEEVRCIRAWVTELANDGP